LKVVHRSRLVTIRYGFEFHPTPIICPHPITDVELMVLSTPDSLADAMNKLHPGGLWRGEWVDISQDPRGLFNFINRNGPFT
ncbi:hypothetical protein, partial [Staphylococcus aureus]|uniref:hypothetical protein n=1 Tax=Staphylococcus aureus TaxID=1280 RepID=UPI003D09A7A0